MIPHPVKLVVWDLDETFWRGTLAEEGMTPVSRNHEVVQELARRGIISSICSENDFERAKSKLMELGVWDWFVFPAISYSPKGKSVSALIETAALRPQNVLFIDDNPSNLEEVKFFNPGIMTGHPDDLLAVLLDHPQLEGTPDPELKRLGQYRVLQRKAEEQGASTLSNEDFLHGCEIRIRIDHDVEKNVERVVDLINRTNQLNFTKLRLNTQEEIGAFCGQLKAFSSFAGTVHVTDRYGDYGLVGFFLVQRRSSVKRLIHFVFSCRTMHMGVEQYIYEMLDRPDIDVAEPVSYGLRTYDKVDWITVDDGSQRPANDTGAGKLVLVGGCDLLQLASYCSADRVEFVNRAQDDVTVRFNDPGFILSDREAIRACAILRSFPTWSYEDAIAFDSSVAQSDLILMSMWATMNGDYFLLDGQVRMRLADTQRRRLRKRDRKAFDAAFAPLEIDEAGRFALVGECFDHVARIAPSHCRVFALGCYSRGEPNRNQARRRTSFNEVVRAYCAGRPDRFHYVDVDAIVPPDMLVDKVHFSRAGYLVLARDILENAAREALRAAR
jgi:FkbH-like protein